MIDTTLALSLAFGSLSAPLATLAQLKPKPATAKAARFAAWQWASMDCQRIPCRIVDPEPGINDALTGPPQLMKDGPAGMMLLYPSGRVEFCFDYACTKRSGVPMTPSEARKYLADDYAEQKRSIDGN